MDMTAIGDKLQGAKVIHNHPGSKDYYGDCFSSNDFSIFCKYRLKRLEVISGLGRFVMEYDGRSISSEKAKELYLSAKNEILSKALRTSKPIDYEQPRIMKKLNEMVQGLKFWRVTK
ncbi:hypothetical protein [uncultured Dialister sp.]|uniref:hypothetical protein n=1 Tax=uncultured Dialister sp. TaxID=278064 RepID=UPI0025D151AD|nr:hypothetical protein [uncultured Dialister sp.]